MDESIAERVFASPEYLSARSIFLYRSLPTEADTSLILGAALSEGKEVYLPRIEGEEMALVRYEHGTKCIRNEYGIEEPEGEPAEVLPDLALIPLVAFDRDKHRLGRGKGYYDRFLARFSGQVIALAYSCQEVAALPVEPFDRSPRVIVTDKERFE